MRQHVIRWIPVMGLVFAAGCGPTIEGLCQAVCDCSEECNEPEYDQCVAEAEEIEQLAEDAGCSEAFDDFLACVDDSLECVDGRAEIDNCEQFLSSCED